MTHTDTTQGRLHLLAIATGKTLAAAVGLAILTHVSWNMFAPDLFGQEPEERLFDRHL